MDTRPGFPPRPVTVKVVTPLPRLRREILRPHGAADAPDGQHRKAADAGGDIAFGRSPAADDVEGGFASEFQIIAPQQVRRRVSPVVGGGEAHMAFGVGGRSRHPSGRS